MLGWATQAEYRTARTAWDLSESMKYKLTAWPPPVLDGRAGDHLWQITINAIEAGHGRPITEAEQRALGTLVAFDDLWIAAGYAGDRLRAVRGK